MLLWSWMLLAFGAHIVPYTSAKLFGGKGEPAVVRTPEERFSYLHKLGYPWKPNYLPIYAHHGLPPLRVHYIDEGPPDAYETLLLLHGTPAWSFLYRTIIPYFLKAGYRVVAIDQIGFGRSDKLTDRDAYSNSLHVKTVVEVVRALDLKGITLIGHDLGGITGLGAAAQDLWRYRRIALMNTWLPQGDMFSSPSSILMHVPYLSWRAVTSVLGSNVPVKGIFTIASDAPKDAVIGGYEAPYPSTLYKAGPAKWPLIIPLSPNDPVAMQNQRAAAILKTFKGPVMVAYSDRELFTLPGRKFFEYLFPHACSSTVLNAGHYLQEDQGPAVASLLLHFIKDAC